MAYNKIDKYIHCAIQITVYYFCCKQNIITLFIISYTRATHVSIVCDYDIYDDTHDNLVYVTEAKGLALILLYLQTVATLVWQQRSWD